MSWKIGLSFLATLGFTAAANNADAKNKPVIDISRLEIQAEGVYIMDWNVKGPFRYHDKITGDYDEYDDLSFEGHHTSSTKPSLLYDARNDTCMWVVDHPIVDSLPSIVKDDKLVVRTLKQVFLDKKCDNNVEAMADVLFFGDKPVKVFDEKRRNKIPRLNQLNATLRDLERENNYDLSKAIQEIRNKEIRKKKQEKIEKIRARNQDKWDEKYR